MLKNASSPVTLGLWRPDTLADESVADFTHQTTSLPRQQTLTARIQKTPSGALGVSLATVTDAQGIYVRQVTDGSPAALEGTLRVGDRLWTVWYFVMLFIITITLF
jgi:hypothetical protein